MNAFTAHFANLNPSALAPPMAAPAPPLASPPAASVAKTIVKVGHELQTLPSTPELDKFIRAAEEQRGRLKHLDLAALEARWTTLADDCRARATPSYKDQHVLSYNGWEREASALIRDISKSITFVSRTRFTHGHPAHEYAEAAGVQKQRRRWLVACRTDAQGRQCGLEVVPHEQPEWDTIAQFLSQGDARRNSRLACARLLMTGLGGASLALAKRATKLEEEAKKVRDNYWSTVRALEASA